MLNSPIHRELAADSALSGVDVCARELIHVPGAVQPHGVLLAVDLATLTIAAASASSAELLGQQAQALMGLWLPDVIGQDATDRVVSTLARLDATLKVPGSIPLRERVAGRMFDAHVHAIGELMILELEPTCAPVNAEELLLAARLGFSVMCAAGDVAAKAARASEALRTLSGYDRVVVYRFTPEWDGEVIGEAADPTLSPLLGLRYPASDVPPQARDLYRRCHMRQVVDVGYEPSPLCRREDTSAALDDQLDLSLCVLRSVSPIHREYLTNMGVRATLVISIMVQDRLWGLVACHHFAPRQLPILVREVMGMLVHKLAGELVRLELTSENEHRVLQQSFRERVVALARGGAAVSELLTASDGDALRQMVSADGVALIQGGTVLTSGDVPGEHEMPPFLEWLASVRTRRGLDFFATDQPAVDIQPAPGAAPKGRLAMALTLSTSDDSHVVWFRSGRKTEITWGGKPHKAIQIALGRPSPRKDFSAWKETVTTAPEPWSSFERAAAGALGYVLDIERRQAREDGLLRLGMAVAAIDDMLIVFECPAPRQLRAIYVNDAYIETTGRQRDGLLGKGVADLLGPTLDIGAVSRLQDSIRLGQRAHIDLELRGRDGRRFWGDIDAVPMVDSAGWIDHWVFLIRDVTHRRLTEVALLDSESRSRQIVQHLDEGVMLLSTDGTVVSVNDSACRLLDWPIGSPHGRRLDGVHWVAVPSAEDSPDTVIEFPLLTTLHYGEAVTQREVGVKFADGRVRVLVISAKTLPTAPGAERRAGSVVVSLRDITNQRAAEKALQEQAVTDVLTGLGNRKRLYAAIEERLRGEAQPFTLMMIDLDDFKEVNDQHGHAVGDELLRQVATRLNGLIREGDLLARLGGDEFVVLAGSAQRVDQVERLGQRIQSAFDSSVQLGDLTMRCGGSVGVAMFPVHGQDRETLLRHADAAMYAAKRAEPGSLRFYDESQDTVAKARTTARSELRRAIDGHGFRLHYQPKVQIVSGRIAGMEALIRWPMPDGSLRSPADFIPLAEATGLIVPLGRWILQQALSDLAMLRQTTGGAVAELTMAINLSARQFLDPGLIDLVRETITSTGVPPSSVQLELTESLIMESDASGRSRLAALKALGVSIAVDDFGTGYSSLAYLHLLPIDTLKIDRTFVKGMAAEGSARVITRGIVALAQSLSLQTVAEGVETLAELEQLRAMGCDQFQGYLFSAARPLDEIAELLTRHDGAAVSP